MKANAVLSIALLTFACVLGCDTDEGPQDAVLESASDAEIPVTEVDAAYVEAHADSNGVVSLDLGDDAKSVYRVDVELLDEVVLESAEASIAAREWLELSDYDYADADSIVFASPNSGYSVESDEGFRTSAILCVYVAGGWVCVLIDT